MKDFFIKLLARFKRWAKISKRRLVTTLVSPGSLSVKVSVGDKKSELPVSKDTCEVVKRSDEQCQYPCGHSAPEWFVLSFYGQESKIKEGKKCPNCMLAVLVPLIARCALCGLPIFPGSGVALYHASSGKLRLNIATMVGDNVLGCLRWGCCPSGGFFAGYWTDKGFQSAFDGQTAADQAYTTGKIIVGNIGEDDK